MNDNGFGTIEFSGDDAEWPGLQFDRIAISPTEELLFISLVGDSMYIKGVRGFLNTNKKVTMTASGVQVNRPGDSEYQSRYVGVLRKADDLYRVEAQALGFGQFHAFVWTRRPGFLLNTEEESLWQELMSDRFTTPLLRAWMPFISRRLRERELLADARGYRCQCGVLAATSADLDEIVSEGVRMGALQLE